MSIRIKYEHMFIALMNIYRVFPRGPARRGVVGLYRRSNRASTCAVLVSMRYSPLILTRTGKSEETGCLTS